jgi:uncharacterized protein (DUF849 family)
LVDFASVNFYEPDAVEVCNVLFAKGIGIEAALATVEDARAFLAMREAKRCLRILLEPAEREVEAALATVAEIERLLDRARIGLPRLLHGYEETTWPLLDAAIHRGYDTRIGLEDTLLQPDGREARDNAELVTLALKRVERL